MKKNKETKEPFKRLFFDIETSPNIVFSWNVGYKLNISHDNIINERAIICICYKWEHESKVHELHWNKGDDKKLLIEFAKIMNQADEIIGHNGDNYDIKWVRARCIYHSIPLIPDFQSIDTLKLSRKGFRFNSNKLDYIASYLGLGHKMDTGGFGLWKSIVLDNDKKAMNTMIAYCKKDVALLEQVFKKLSPYVLHKSHKAVHQGGEPHNCPECGNTHCISNGVRIMANGLKKRRMHCQDCGKYFSISNTVYEALKPIIDEKEKSTSSTNKYRRKK